MLPADAPNRLKRAVEAMSAVTQGFFRHAELRKKAGSDACDFAYGNPHDMPLPGVVDALSAAVPPRNKDWYAYKLNEASAVNTVAQTLRQLFDEPFAAEDIFMTNGASGALHVVLNAILDHGEEVIFNSPPWFFYEGMILNSGGEPVRARIDPESFDLDLAAIERAISNRTRAIIVNSPNNPTGKIYPRSTLRSLADMLTRQSQRRGRTIYLISDEAYRRIVYDGREFASPTTFYPHSFMLYTYGKTLLTPGQRLGYIALPPGMPNREEMRTAIVSTQLLSGPAVVNALLQHALPEIETLSIDIEHLQHRRDWLVSALRECGYEVHIPEGTFYLLPRSPISDDVAFTDALAEEGVFCLPGTIVEMPGTFRISLTANDEMIERAIPRFASVFAAAVAGQSG